VEGKCQEQNKIKFRGYTSGIFSNGSKGIVRNAENRSPVENPFDRCRAGSIRLGRQGIQSANGVMGEGFTSEGGAETEVIGPHFLSV
jgi:hypothetical protein